MSGDDAPTAIQLVSSVKVKSHEYSDGHTGWDYDLFWPLEGEKDIPKCLSSLNKYIIDARFDAHKQERQKLLDGNSKLPGGDKK